MTETPSNDDDNIPLVKADDMEKRTAQFLKLRAMLKELDDRQTKERAPLVQLMDELSGRIRKFMDTNNLENLRTAAGTCYTSTRFTASVADAELFMKHVIDTQDWDLIERRANSTAVRAYVEKNNHLPAGVNLSGVQTLGVRAPQGKAKTKL